MEKNSRFGIFGLLFLAAAAITAAFVALRVAGVIAWDWWWLVSPLLAFGVLSVVLAVVVVILSVLIAAIETGRGDKHGE